MYKKWNLYQFAGAWLAAAMLVAVTANANDWKAPGTEIQPEARMYPKSVSKSRWLWFQAPVNTQRECFLRGTLMVEGKVKKAEIIGYFDDSGEFYLNGKKLANAFLPQKKLPMRALKFVIAEKLKDGVNHLAFHVVNNKHGGGLIFLGKIEYASGKTVYFHSDKNLKAAATATPGWFRPEFDDSAWAPAKSFGDVQAYPWERVTDVAHWCMTSEEKEVCRQLEKAATVLPDELSTEPDKKLKVLWQNGIPALELDGNIIPPVFFLCSAPKDVNKGDMLIKMSRTGIRIIELGIDTKRIEIGNGKYDFSQLDQDVGRILHLYPQALICINMRFSCLNHWLEKNQDEMIGYATGPADNKTSKLWHSLDVGGRGCRPSMASRPFRGEILRFVGLFGDYLRNRPWFKRLVAIRVSYGIYSEWHYFGMGGQMPDTGKAMTGEFKDFLRKKYRTELALRKAWHDDKITFDTVTVPDVSERYGKYRFLRDPATADRKVMDYYDCHQNVIADTLLLMAGAVKRSMPKLLVGAYYGYVFSMGQFPSEGQTLALEKILSSPHIDFLSAPYDYNVESRYMGGVGTLRTIPASFIRHKKLALAELDIRTHRTPEKVFRNVTTGAESGEIFKRDMANCAISGIGAQLVDMALPNTEQWFNDPLIIRAIRKCMLIWPEIHENKEASSNRIAVVFNPQELVYHGYPTPAMQEFNIMLSDKQLHALYKSGYTFDLMSLNDYMRSTKKYNVLVFMNLFTLNSKERAEIIFRTRQKGVTSVWIYAPGLVTETGYSAKAMSDLTGIDLAFSTEKLPIQLKLTSRKIIGNENLRESPRVYSMDKNAEIIGRYSNQRVGMVRKKLAQGATSVFCGVPINDSSLWADIFNKAGAHAYCREGIFVKSGHPYLLVHVGCAGDYRINLPGKTRNVQDVFAGKSIGKNVDGIILRSSGCKTWLLKLEN